MIYSIDYVGASCELHKSCMLRKFYVDLCSKRLWLKNQLFPQNLYNHFAEVCSCANDFSAYGIHLSHLLF